MNDDRENIPLTGKSWKRKMDTQLLLDFAPELVI